MAQRSQGTVNQSPAMPAQGARVLHSHVEPRQLGWGAQTMAKTGFGFLLKNISPYLFGLLL